jgi:hypothetical protein
MTQDMNTGILEYAARMIINIKLGGSSKTDVWDVHYCFMYHGRCFVHATTVHVHCKSSV